MRTRTLFGSFALFALASLSACSSSDDGAELPPDAGAFDAPNVDVVTEASPDVASEAMVDAPVEAQPEAAPDADAGDAGDEADAGDAEVEADACQPTTYDCQNLFVGSVGDAGATPSIQLEMDVSGGTVTVQLADNAPAVASATADVSYISQNDTSVCVTTPLATVPLTVTGNTLSAAIPPTFLPPEDFYAWCGTLHLTDGCNIVTDVPLFTGYVEALDDTQLACAGTCGPDQWKAHGTNICNACPLPGLFCSDVENPSFDPSSGVFTFGPDWNSPSFTATEVTLPYHTTSDDAACSGLITIPLTMQADGTIKGMIATTPADFSSFDWDCKGTVKLSTGCSQSFDFELMGGVGDFDDVQFYTACSD